MTRQTALGNLKTLNLQFSQILRDLKYDGIISQPRGLEVKEQLGCTFELDDPRNRIIMFKDRNTSYQYLLAELIWYLSGSNEIEGIVDYAPFWSQITNKDKKTVNSAYGYRIFGKADFIPYNQWEKVKKVLRKDPDSRQAIIHINQPIDYTYANKDVPCTLDLQFFIRDNQLSLIVNMRSNDAILGLTNDVFQFTMLQEIMQCQLKNEDQFKDLELGKYYHRVGSMHVYDRHYSMVDNIISDSDEKLDNAIVNVLKSPVQSNDNNALLEMEIVDQFVDYPMHPMELEKDTIKNLISVEKAWRKSGRDKSYDFEKLTAYTKLPDYWKSLIKTCFNGIHFQQDCDLILEYPAIDDQWMEGTN